MSEEETIKNLEEFLKGPCEICKYCDGAIRNHRKAIQGLLDLYNKEKEKRQYYQDMSVELATRLDATETDYQEEKEKNKELEKRLEEIELQILEDENY